ncbi:AEC family transporter [Synechocystis sp. PCC 7509]|uniref:AEC family transporter n=1 Tax=Synechocystis sp. PCC 7509 TaxID=927677 RepID=UPI0002AC7211|nr:AEC family transporter [Synechocystis sp. PCC 7509]
MKLLQLYLPLIALVLSGFIISGKLPATISLYLGQFLFWVGVPLSIMAFLRQADLSGAIWVAPIVAWIAVFLGAGLAWVWINWQSRRTAWSKPTQGSFILATMAGNTGYLGYPVTLAFVGTQYFGYALFYDLLGTTLAVWGLGVVIAAAYGGGVQSQWQLVKVIAINPSLWGFGVGLLFRQVPLPTVVETTLNTLGWAIVALSLVLIGMRLRQLDSWHSLPKASISLSIKMLVVPLLLGSSLSLFGVTGAAKLAIVLQMAMPPAFATLVIAEVYNLDRDLSVTALAVGSGGLLVTLPIWLWLFS